MSERLPTAWVNRGVPIQAAIEAFQSRFAAEPSVVAFAPGRVNLIGEHTDYNEGFVMPAAISLGVAVAASPSTVSRSDIWSQVHECSASFDIGELPDGWGRYPAAVAKVLLENGLALPSVKATIASNLPIGAGLSSSAAIEVAYARAMLGILGRELDALEVARLCQRAENVYVGVQCGLMDQAASALGRQGYALLIDMRSLDVRPVPIPEDVALLIADTGARRELASSAYNERRRDCEAACSLLGLSSLRDASVEDVRRLKDPVLRRRAMHVVTENLRTLDFATAMAAGDLASCGQLMLESHESLRLNFEVSSPELDTMAQLLRESPGCFGARMTGGGFGGCCIALVERDDSTQIVARVTGEYQVRTGMKASVFASKASNGAMLMPFPR